MPALKAQGLQPDLGATKRERALRLANSGDVGGGSDVASLQHLIEAEFSEHSGVRPWPRAVSVPLTIAAAGGLWWGIFAAAKAILRY